MKKILGLDLGSNSIGWALMRETDGEVSQIIEFITTIIL
jgi:CRISPR/Cas system Type II protein with McrA/HNH and RuvC-like nuclease domain